MIFKFTHLHLESSRVTLAFQGYFGFPMYIVLHFINMHKTYRIIYLLAGTVVIMIMIAVHTTM